MKQLAIFGDLHIGRRPENNLIRKHIREGQVNFFDHSIELLKSRNIDTVIFTGDLLDQRNSIGSDSLIQLKRLLKEKFKGFKKHIILGNHDIFFESSYEITPFELFQEIEDTYMYIDSVGKIELLGKTWYMTPWLLPDNEKKFIKFLETLSTKPKEVKDTTVIFGHFDILNMLMEGSGNSMIGIDPNLFYNAAKLTISGHYHDKSINTKHDNTILYVGSPFAFTFANESPHGIWILNEDLSYEFLENTISPNFKTILDTHDLDNLPDLSNSFVRFYYNTSHSPEEMAIMKLKIDAKKPLLIANSIPYSENVIEVINQTNEEEANKYLHMDIMKLGEVYVNGRESDLPKLKFYKDPKDEILKRLRKYDE